MIIYGIKEIVKIRVSPTTVFEDNDIINYATANELEVIDRVRSLNKGRERGVHYVVIQWNIDEDNHWTPSSINIKL